MNKQVERSEAEKAVIDEASELSKDDLGNVNGGVISLPKNPPPFVTPVNTGIL